MTTLISHRNLLFILFNILVLIIFGSDIKALVMLSLDAALFSYIILIPFISAFFVYINRKKIFLHARYSFTPGVAILLSGLLMRIIDSRLTVHATTADILTLTTISALLFWIGGFVLFYGTKSLGEARFAFLYLIFMVPIPSAVTNEMISMLKHGSAEVTNILLKLSGIPFIREDQIFHLPELSIEVADECSGIRSSIALLITGIMAGHIFLRTGWAKTLLVLAVLPIALLKNGLRITALSLSAAYIDESYLTNSFIHENGGVLFLLPSLLILFLLLKLLRKGEQKRREKPAS